MLPAVHDVKDVAAVLGSSAAGQHQAVCTVSMAAPDTLSAAATCRRLPTAVTDSTGDVQEVESRVSKTRTGSMTSQLSSYLQYQRGASRTRVAAGIEPSSRCSSMISNDNAAGAGAYKQCGGPATMSWQAVHVCGDGVSPGKRAQEPQRGAPGEPVEDGPLDDQQREAEPHDRLAAPAGQTMHDR